jgi:hypothetical protein
MSARTIATPGERSPPAPNTLAGVNLIRLPDAD